MAPNCTARDPCLPRNACTCTAQSTQTKNTTTQPKLFLKNSAPVSEQVVQTPSAANLPPPAQVLMPRKRSPSNCARCEHDAGPPKRARKPAHTCGAGVAPQPANHKKFCGLLPLNPIQRIQGTVVKPGLQNLGSTCYFNACLTTDAALQPLHAVLFRPPRQHNCISSNGCLLCALHTFGSVFLTSSSDLASRIAEPLAAVVGLLQRTYQRFVNSREHDAHDAWTSLLQLALQNLRADTSNTRYGRRSSTQCCGKHRKLSSKQ